MPTTITASFSGEDKTCNCCNCCDELSAGVLAVVSLTEATQCWTRDGDNDYFLTRNISNPSPVLVFGEAPTNIGTLGFEGFPHGSGCPSPSGPSATNPVSISASCNFAAKEITVDVSQVYINIICRYVFDCETLIEKSKVCVGTADCACYPCTAIAVTLEKL